MRVIDEVEVADSSATDVPEEARRTLEFPLIRRRVWLENADGLRLGYAVSWWNAAVYRDVMADPSKPIGGSLAKARTDIYREIFEAYRGVNAALSSALPCGDDGVASPTSGGGGGGVGLAVSTLWGRHYIMWRGGAPLCLVCEVFSPLLQRFMGEYRDSSSSSN